MERRDDETKKNIDRMNGKVNDIITLMQTNSLSGSAVERKRISWGDIGRKETTPKEYMRRYKL